MSNVDWNFGDLIDEAVENAGLDPAALTHRHLNSIQRSLQLLHIDLENKGANAEFRIETRTWTVAPNAGGVVLDTDVIDVTQASILYSSSSAAPVPYPLGRTTREDYLNLTFPTQTGMPSVYWLSKSIRTVGNTEKLPTGVVIPPASSDTPVLVLWPQNGLTGTVQVSATIFRQHAMPANFGAALDTRRAWLPTICAGLSARIAKKYNPEMYGELNGEFQDMLQKRDADEDHHPVIIAYRGAGWGRGRRH